MTDDRGLDHSETIDQNTEVEISNEFILLAQADTTAAQTSEPSGPAVAANSEIAPDSDNKVVLDALVSIENIQVDGSDLILIQPDGSQVRIVNGALNVPTFIIGEIEVPQDVLVAALNTNGFNVAAGPGNTLSVTPQAPTGSGGDFQNSGASIAGDGLDTLSLLQNDAEGSGGGEGEENIAESGNIAATLTGGAVTGAIVESLDNPGGVDADPTPARGSISFFDPDFGDTREAEVASRTVVSQALNGGATLTPAQLDALLAGFSLVTPGGITVESVSAAGGTIDWTYAVSNGAVDFLAAGETVTLSFGVRINDGIFSTIQIVTVTVTGTNDAPVIAAIAQSNLTEQSDTAALTAAINVSFTDVDLTDTGHTATVTAATASGVTSGLALDAAALIALVTPGTVTKASGSAPGSVTLGFSAASTAFDYLSVGEVVTLTYTLAINDLDGGVTSRDFVVTITGTNDAPVIAAIAQSNLTEQTGTSALTTAINVSFTDVDLTDTGHTATVTAAIASGVTTGLALDAAALIALVTPGTVTKASGSAAGSVTLGFSAASTAFDYLSVGEVVTLTYTLAINDLDGGVTSRDFVVTITGTNDAPVIDASTGASTSEQTNASLSLAAITATGQLSFTDVDLSDVGHTATVVGAVARSGETDGLSLFGFALPDSLLRSFFSVDAAKAAGSSAGTIDYTFSASDLTFDYLAKGQSVTLTYTVRLTDGDGGVTTQQVPITIFGTNDRPQIMLPAVRLGVENAGMTGSDALESHSGTMAFIDLDRDDVGHTASAELTGTSGTTTGLDLTLIENAVAINSVTKTINSQSGSIAWSFSAVDRAFDYLARGEQVTLTYTVTLNDNEGEANSTTTSTVTVRITGTNDAPVISVASGDTASVQIQETNSVRTASVTLTVNDVDLSDTVTAEVVGVSTSGTTLGIGVTNAQLQAMLSLTSGAIAADSGDLNNLAWNFVSTGERFNYLANDEQITLNYTIRVSDGKGGTDDQVISITINGRNDAPNILGGNVSTQLLETNDPLTTSGTFTVRDRDLSDTVTVSKTLVSVDGTANGRTEADLLAMFSVPTGALTANQSESNNLAWSFSSGSDNFNDLAAGETLTLTYRVRATDDSASAASDSKTVTITITGTNDAPAITWLESAGGITETAGQTGVEANLHVQRKIAFTDVDLENGVHSLEITPLSTTHPNGTTFLGTPSFTMDDAAGTAAGALRTLWFNLDVAGSALDFLAAGQTYTQTYQVRVYDGRAYSNVETITITFTGTNDAATISIDSAVVDDRSVTEAGGLANATAGDPQASGKLLVSDVDTGEAVFSAPAAASLNGAYGTFTFNHLTGEWNYALDNARPVTQALTEGQAVTETLTVTSADGTATHDIVVTVTGSNDAPVAVGDTIDMVFAGTPPATLAATPVFNEVENNNNINQANVIDRASLAIAPNPNLTDQTDPSVTVKGSITGGSTDFFAITLKAGETIILDIDNTSGNLDTTLGLYNSGGLALKFNDDMNDTSVGGGGSVGGNGSFDSYLTYTATTDGTYYIEVGRFNGVGGGTTGTYELQVSIDNFQWATGAAATIPVSTLLANDYDVDNGDTLTVVSVSGNGVALVGTNVIVQPGVASFTYTVRDSQGAESTATVVVNQIVPNSDPIANNDNLPIGGVSEDAVATFPTALLLGNDTDADVGDTLTVTGLGAGNTLTATTANGATVTLNAVTGEISYDPTSSATIQALAEGATLTDSFSYSISDGHGGTATATASLVVNGVNDAAIISGTETGAVTEDGTLTAGGTLTVTDPDTGEALFEAPASLAGTYGTFTFNATTGVWGYTLNNAASNVQALNASDTVNDTLTVKSIDGTATQDITVSLTGSNDAPVILTSVALQDAGFETPNIANGVHVYNPDGSAWSFTGYSGIAGNNSAFGNDTAPEGDQVAILQHYNSLSGMMSQAFTANAGSLTLELNARNRDVGELGQAPFRVLVDGVVVGTITPTSTTFETYALSFTLATGGSHTLAFQSIGNPGNGDVTAFLDTISLTSTDGSVLSMAVAENDVGATVGSFTVSDIDTATGLTFRVLDSSDQPDARFVVVAASGTIPGQPGIYELQLAPGVSLDFETAASIALKVEVDDHGLINNLTTVPVTVTVSDVNEAPTFDAITGSVGEDGPSFSANLLTAANASDVDGDTLSVANPAATVTTGGGRVLTLGTHYTLTGSSFALTPAGFALFNSLAQDEDDSFTFAYEISDGTVALANTLTVTVNGTNDLPVAVLDNGSDNASFRMTEDDGSKTFDVRANDTLDPDAGAPNTVTLGSIAVGTNWLGLTAADVQVTVTAQNEIQVQLLGAQWNGLTVGSNVFVTVSYSLNGDQPGDVSSSQLIVRVDGVNDAPVLDASKSPDLGVIEAGAGVPVGAVGVLVSSLVDNAAVSGGLDNVTDDGFVFGMALTGTSTSGTWHWSPNGGATWIAVNPVSDTNALLLRPEYLLYFQPNPGFDGQISDAITFRAWDGTGTPGQYVNTSVNGGITGFSTATDTASITVNGIDDPLTVNDTTSADGRYAMSRNSDSPNTINLDASSLFSGGTGAVSYTYQLVSAPASTSWLSIVGGVISGNPSDSHAGNYIYKVTATDSAGSISTYIALTVLPDSGWNVETVGGNISAANLFFQSNGFHDVVTFTGANTVEANAGSLIDVMLGQGGINTMNGGSGDDALYGMGGNDILKGGDGNDFIDGGAGNDILVGGAGNDTLVGGSGSDQFRIASDSGSDIIADFLPGTDKIGLLDTGSTGSGSVNFANTIGTSAGAALNPLDFITRGSVNTVVNSDDNSVVVITSTQTNSQITTTTIGTNVSSTAVNTYIVVFNSTSNAAQIWFDDNWSSTSGRTLIATLHGVTAAQVAAMTSTSFVVYNNAADPIILDLDGNGFTFGAPVLFDINGDGAKDRVAWNTSGDGMLAFDLNGDGVINDGTELFTPWFNGGAFGTGADALASLDTNGDGVIDMNDAAFANLLVWNDVNADGVSDAGELTSLAANGIASISLSTTQTLGEIDGQTVIGEGTFTRVDGSTGSFIEVELDTSLGTLGGDGDDLLMGGSGSDMIAAGSGADTFVFDMTALSDALGGGILDLIADYDFGQGDMIDLSALLGDQPVTEGNASDYVQINGAFLEVDIDGAGGASGFVQIAEFAVVPGVDALRILVDDSANPATVII